MPRRPNEPLLSVHRRVLAAVNCETTSVASYVALAELALYLSVEDNNPEKTRLLDLLCHLRHWAEANEVDFEVASREAEHHYSVERYDPYAMEVPQEAAK